MKYKQLIKELANQVALSQFEVNHQCYKEEAECYAKEGVTESKYMKGTEEHIEFYVDEVVAIELLERAKKEYKRLIKEKYNK